MENEQALTELDIENKSYEELEALERQMLHGEEPEPTPDTPQPEDPPQDQLPAEPEPPQPTIEERLALLEKENQTLHKRVEDGQSFIQRRNQEIGLLRQQVQDLQNPPAPPVTQEDMERDPTGATQRLVQQELQRREQMTAKEKEQQELQIQEFEAKAKEALVSWEPEYDNLVDDMAALIEADGADEETVAKFKSKPHATYAPVMAFQLAQRAKASRRIHELEAEVAKLKGKPQEIISQAQRASRARTKVSTSAPKPAAEPPQVTEADLENMSYEELEALEKKLLRR